MRTLLPYLMFTLLALPAGAFASDREVASMINPAALARLAKSRESYIKNLSGRVRDKSASALDRGALEEAIKTLEAIRLRQSILDKRYNLGFGVAAVSATATLGAYTFYPSQTKELIESHNFTFKLAPAVQSAANTEPKAAAETAQ